MVKEIKNEPGRTFAEYTLLPQYTPAGCTIQNVSLHTDVAGIKLPIPLLSAAMTSVTGLEMTLALGREGGLPILPVGFDSEQQADIVRRAKEVEMGFVSRPVKVDDRATIEQVLRKMENHGHSKIPVVNVNNVLLGMFDQHYFNELEKEVRPNDLVTQAMVPLNQLNSVQNPDLSILDAQKHLNDDQTYLVVLDSENRLSSLAFKRDMDSILVGAAISTHPGWKERAYALAQAGVDLLVIDSSDAHSEFAVGVLEEYKKMSLGIPICAGNVVTYEGALKLMEAGADAIKVGMSSGSICTTANVKAVGRAPMTALLDVARAQRDYQKSIGRRHVSLIVDGGVSSTANMVIALCSADAVMVGGYLNRCWEAQGEKFDKNGKITTLEEDAVAVATWGEGSERARNLLRYAHASQRTFYAEGVEGRVPYEGRVKAKLGRDLIAIKGALTNTGVMNLQELKEKAVLEPLSLYAMGIVATTHGVEVKK